MSERVGSSFVAAQNYMRKHAAAEDGKPVDVDLTNEALAAVLRGDMVLLELALVRLQEVVTAARLPLPLPEASAQQAWVTT